MPGTPGRRRKASARAVRTGFLAGGGATGDRIARHAAALHGTGAAPVTSRTGGRGARAPAMTNILVLLSCFALGILLRHAGRLPPDGYKVLNAFVINVALPALVLRHMNGLRPANELLLPIAMPWLLFALGVAFFWCLGRAVGWSSQTTGGLMLSGGLANTSFVGLPMIEAFYGPAFLGIGILADQLGSYLVLSTLGIVVATLHAAGGPVTVGEIGLKILGFPPFQAVMLGLVLLPVEYPPGVSAVLDRLSGTLVPLALVSVGCQLRLDGIRALHRELAAGLLFKLVLGPAMIAFLFVTGLGAGGTIAQVTVFEAAMGPMIGGAIVAIEYGLNPRLVTLMVGVGIPLSLMTAAAWCLVLSRL